MMATIHVRFAPDSVPGLGGPGLAPLHQVRAGRRVRIRELLGTPELAGRLRELGLGEGQIIRLVAGHANIICQVCQSRLALSAALAQLVLVELLPG